MERERVLDIATLRTEREQRRPLITTDNFEGYTLPSEPLVAEADIAREISVPWLTPHFEAHYGVKIKGPRFTSTQRARLIAAGHQEMADEEEFVENYGVRYLDPFDGQVKVLVNELVDTEASDGQAPPSEVSSSSEETTRVVRHGLHEMKNNDMQIMSVWHDHPGPFPASVPDIAIHLEPGKTSKAVEKVDEESGKRRDPMVKTSFILCREPLTGDPLVQFKFVSTLATEKPMDSAALTRFMQLWENRFKPEDPDALWEQEFRNGMDRIEALDEKERLVGLTPAEKNEFRSTYARVALMEAQGSPQEAHTGITMAAASSLREELNAETQLNNSLSWEYVRRTGVKPYISRNCQDFTAFTA